MKKKTLYIKKHRYKKQSIDDLKSGKLKTWWTKKKMKFQQLLYREHYEKEEGVSNSRLNDLFDNY